ncbi:DUF6438 domain-containing protein [Taibaiella soli]|uniref:DUF6438 domain-containing protein n=1 Tax=Taibaiella soli TaxID=1649169 RepID=A0A2W2BTT1_9BACT|nr:DUF6438 domain-containing protein [Taibaiella soli]PZF71213.1 hypothetical protein DN068_19770 [Taibaiella soli]
MRKLALSLLPVLMISLFACAQKKISYVKMNRTACFGRCPVYSVEIYDNGLVRYSGQYYTDHQGVYETNIGKSKAQNLMKQFSKYRVDTCQNEYVSRISDIPGIIYNIKYGKTNKRINNAHFGPMYLRTLAANIDSLSQVNSSWKKKADTAILKY